MTAHISISTMRFEDAPVTLGDELRGARASLNKSLEQIESDLKIRSSYILAIERGAVDELPDPAYASGFVRAYARYLGINGENALRRFQQENGLPTSARPPISGRAPVRSGISTDPLAALASHGRSRRGLSFVGKLLAGLVPVLVIAAIAYGAWTVFQGGNGAVAPVAAPAPAPPARVETPDETAVSGARPTLEMYEEGVAQYWSAPPPEIRLPDGPIADLAANYALRALPEPAPTAADDAAAADPAPDGGSEAVDAEDTGADTADAGEVAPPPAPTGAVTLYAEDAVWVQVKAGDRVVFTGTLQPEQRYEVPDGGAGHVLRAGNAGSLILEIGGTRIAPLGAPGGVVKNVPLDAEGARAFVAPEPAPVEITLPPVSSPAPSSPAAANRAPVVERAPAPAVRRAPAPVVESPVVERPVIERTVITPVIGRATAPVFDNDPAPAFRITPSQPAPSQVVPQPAPDVRPSIVFDPPVSGPAFTPAPQTDRVGFGRMNPVE